MLARRFFPFYLLLGLGILALAAPSAAMAKAQARRGIVIELEEVSGASLYEIYVVRKDGGRKTRPVTFRTRNPLWESQIKPGLYTMKLRAYDSRGVPGEWSEPFDYLVKATSPELKLPRSNEIVVSQKPETARVQFQWEKSLGATSYRLQVFDWNAKLIREEVTETPSATLKLDAAKVYQWRVIPIQDQNEGEVMDEKRSFTLQGPTLSAPELREPITTIVTEITWPKVEHAERYEFLLSSKDLEKGRWQEVDSGVTSMPRLSLDLSRPSGIYRLSVRSTANHRISSKEKSIEFEVQGGFRDPAAIEAAQLRQTLERRTDFYLIASYFLTQMEYSSRNYDANSEGSFPALGGTGRLGLGYQRPRKPWGIFGIVDLSGFNIGGQNYSFPSMELHGTWRIQSEGKGRVLLGYGIYTKELPILLSQGEAFQGVGSIRHYGLHVGGQYWRALNDKYGLQFNARIYAPLSGSAPSGQSVDPTLSFQLGALGSYRLTESIMGLAGYAFRLDQSQFTSRTSSSSKNLVEIKGHYLNLLIEWSF